MRLAWNPAGRSMAWAAVSRAVRAPTRIDRDVRVPGEPPFLVVGNPDFPPEVLIAYELGYRVRPRPGLLFDLATFYDDYDDLRSQEPSATGLPLVLVTRQPSSDGSLGNRLQATTSGAELTTRFAATRRLHLQSGLTWLASDLHLEAGSGDPTGGRSEANDPAALGFLRADLDLPPDVTLDALAQAQLVEDLLDVSRIITGKLRLDLRPVELPSVLETVADTARSAAEAKRLTVEVEIPESQPAPLGDPARRHQAIWNLVSNAVKFTPAEGRIWIRARLRDGAAESEVEDQGIGIDPAFLAHVFERVRQEDSSTTRSHGGLGLGLAIVRHLVELHGGEVEAESPAHPPAAERFVLLLRACALLETKTGGFPMPIRRFASALAPLLVVSLVPMASFAAPPAAAALHRAGPFASMDQELAQMNREIPGFGGLFYDRAGRATVYLTDPGDARALGVLGRGVRVLRGEFEFRDLLAWRQDLRPAVLGLPGVVLLDVDEATNRVRVGVRAERLATTRLRLAVEAARRGIPGQALRIEAADPIFEVATLQDQFRPVPGGVEIASGNQFQGFSICSLGFNAVRDGVPGFVTASHCTDRQGGVESTRFLQPFGIFATAIATETVDPEYLRRIPGCPGGRYCRYSDSAFAAYDSSDLSDFGQIARTTARDSSAGPLTIDSAHPTFSITSTSSSAVGEEVDKVGRTTGWTYGTVTATCVDVAVSGTHFEQLCQDTVAAGVGPGDSGSPAFAWDGGDSVSLRGIVWGSNQAGTLFVYSPFANVVRSDELGALTVN